MIALAATGVLSAVWVALLHNLGTFIVIANAGRLLRMDEEGIQSSSGGTKPREVS